MARYSGPVCRQCRREQTKLFLKGEKCYTKCVLDRRPTPPGQAKPARGKPSSYAIRLREKQKLRRMAGVTERPLRRLMEAASKKPEATGEQLLRSLELRLDNVVKRSGIAASLKGARQFVLHRHVLVGGRRVNIPSYVLKPGDVVSCAPALKDNVGVKLSLETAKRLANRPGFLEFDEEKLSVKVLRAPERSEMSWLVNDQLIVEYYSR